MRYPTLVLSLLVIGLLSCHRAFLRYEDVPNPERFSLVNHEYNVSSYEVWVDSTYLPPDVCFVFYRSALPETMGAFVILPEPYLGYLFVIAVDVDECVLKGVSLTLVLSHEIIHYHQFKRSRISRREWVERYRDHGVRIEWEAITGQFTSPPIALIGGYRNE